MTWPPIPKLPSDWRAPPNLLDYDAVRRGFDWAAIRSELAGLPEGRGFNIAHETVDRHASGPLRDKVAFRWLGARESSG